MQFNVFSSKAQGPHPAPYPFPTGGAASIGASLPACMKDVILPISTGVNWQATLITTYPDNTLDKYWHLVSNDNGPQVMCAMIYQTGCPIIYNGTRAISVVFSGNCSNNCNMWGNLMNNHVYYTFRRYFWVDADPSYYFTCNLSLNLIQDDKLDAVRVNGNSIGFNSGINNYCEDKNWIGNVTIHGGQNFIDVDILNANFNGGTSPMFLNISGILSYAGPAIFVKNTYYVPNTLADMGPMNCVLPNQYITVPTFANTCLATGVSGIVNISNYNPAFTYTLLPGNTTITNTFTGIGGNTYTINVNDGKGCSLNSVINIGKPSLTLSANNCLATGATSTITANAINGNAPYQYAINGGALQVSNTFTNNLAGIYTVLVVDAQNCSASSTIEIVDGFSATLTSNKLCISNLESATLTATHNSMNLPVNYNFLPAVGTFIPPNQYLTTQPDIYTVTITDAFGCTATSAINLYMNTVPNISVTPVNNVAYCENTPVQLGAFPNQATLTYTWAGSPVPPLVFTGNPTQVNNNITSTYTVTATNVLGCTKTASYTHYTNPFCCTDIFYIPSTHLISTCPLYNNGNATGILASFGNPAGNIITTNDHILIDGNVIIDQDIIFKDCPNLFFMPNAQLFMQNGKTLTIDNSTCRAACEWWKGILATNSTQTVIIKNNAWLEKMTHGVQIAGVWNLYDAPILQCDNATFAHNIRSIYFAYTPLGYTGYVRNSHFYDNPSPNAQNAEMGIRIENCLQLAIGGNAMQGNYFHSMKNGIYILNAMDGPPLMRISLLNNKFEDFIGGPQVNNTNDNIYSSHVGCAIYSHGDIINKILLVINNNNAITHFKDVDKALVAQYTHTSISNTNVLNAKAGFMHSLTQGCRSFVRYNTFTNSLISISYTGNDLAGSLVHNNTINMPTTQAVWFPLGNPFDARGIQLVRNSNMYNAAFDIYDNIIHLNHRKNQWAICLDQTGDMVNVRNNEINMPFGISNAGVTMANQSRGIYAVNADKSIILDNIVRMGGTFGKGFQFRNSTNLRIFCNDIESAYGMWVEGDNTTAWDNIGNNRMAGLTNSGIMLNCMRFNWIIPAIDGRFGNIGTQFYDMNNKFHGMVPSEMVCKYSTIGCLQYYINTNSYNLTPANTNCGNIFNCYYYAANYIIPDIFECNPPLNIAYKNVIDTAYSVRLARAEVDFSNYPAAAQLELQKLYEKLHTDSTLRTNQPVLDSFYQAYHSGNALYMLQVKNILHSLMSDSIAMSDSTTYHTILNAAYTANETINSNVFGIVHEKNMNSIYIHMLRYGLDSITAAQYNAVESLAAECPYSVGRGVYLARYIQSMYKPGITYNDRGICGAAYKNGSPEEDDEIARKKSEEALAKLKLLENKITLYPNPTGGLLTLEYYIQVHTTATLTFYDMTGNEVLRTTLDAQQSKATIDIKHLASGIYVYKYQVPGHETLVGKINKN